MIRAMRPKSDPALTLSMATKADNPAVVTRPRLLYFNGPWDYLGDRMIAAYMDPFRRLLEQDFEVISVQGDRNLRHEVEQHRPDMILFHTGTESDREKEVTIVETDAFREIPRVGYIYRDPISPSRISAMNRLLKWGVDQTFTCFRPSDAPIPFFKDTIYVPWWIDDTVFRDYGEKKEIPIALTGAGWLSRQFFYTWRCPIFIQLVSRFAVFHVPVFENHKNGHAYVGEGYARLLNQSLFSAACGSANRFLTLKPLEIPACRCCLIAEETEVFKAIGFADGVNCIFADHTNVAAKVQDLLDHPERLQAITNAGYDLVHQRHTQRNRRMFIEWFHLWKSKRPGQCIVQTDPLRPLQLAAEGSSHPYEFPAENPMVESLLAGYALMREERWQEAVVKFDQILNVIPYVAEARLGAAICQLRLNGWNLALQHLTHNLHSQVRQRSMAWPDVLNLAFLGVAMIGNGKKEEALNLLGQRPELRHPALNALRWFLAQRQPELRSHSPAFQISEGDESQNIETVHLLPTQTFAEWVSLWATHLPVSSLSAKTSIRSAVAA